ncbi:MAG: 3-hydroxyacyl-CoA dehydrogenase NAD-binding domain-containing protein [Gemmatimonadota bacterium]
MQAEDIRTAAVVGAGTMGAGIAGVLARAGCAVRVQDLDEAALDRGRALLAAGQQALVDAGRVTRAAAATAADRVRFSTDLEAACAGVDLLVEAASEDLALKRQLFARFDDLCPPAAVLATNTSGLSISRIAAATARPAQVAGVHFWNPPHLIPLVEVTRGEATSDATADLLLALARRVGKRPILVRCDVPGFVGNRLQFAVFREALHILSEGIASAADIDAAMTAGPGLRYGFLGPLRTADLGGLDVFRAISSYLFAELGSETGVPEALEEQVRAGRLGAKSGAGFYDYAGGEFSQIVAERDRILLGFLEVLERERGHRGEAP